MPKQPSIAKITRPKLSKVLPRTRLFRVLDLSRKQSNITLIAGPAGSGKTTLVSSYLDSRKLPCLWYQVDQGDNDLATFFYYLGIASKKSAPRFKKPLPLLTPEYLQGITTFARRFFENIFSRLKPPFAVVFDNYQNLPNASLIHDIINTGLSIIPDGIRFFVLSRNDYPPAFERRRTNGEMQVVGWHELRFTPEESKQIIRMKEKRKLPAAALAEVHRKADGWAAGLVLLMEGAGTKSPEQAINGLDQKSIFNYFAGEVFDKLDTETRDFLLMTSFLPKMTVDVARKIAEQENAGRILSTLNRDHFFTGRHSTGEPSYEYHPLFRDFLMARVRESFSPEGVNRIQMRAAAALAEAGQVEDAVCLLREGRDWQNLVRLILINAKPFMLQGRSTTLLEWITSIPAEITNNSPWLLYWKAACRLPFNPPESRALTERAFNLFEKQKDLVGTLLSWSGAVHTFLVEFDDYRPLDKWIAWIDDRMTRGLAFPSPEIEAMVASAMTGALIWRAPDHPHIAQWVERSLSSSRKNQDMNVSLQAGILSAYYYLMCMGQFAECGMLMDEMKKMSQLPAITPLTALRFKAIESLFCDTSWKFKAEAIRSVKEGLEISRQTGVFVMDPLLFVFGIYSALNAGEISAAGDYLSKLEKVVGTGHRTYRFHFLFCSAWYNLFTGPLHQSALLAQNAADLAKEIGTPSYEFISRLLLVQAHYEMGKRAEAEKELKNANAVMMQIGSTFFHYLCLIVEACFASDRKEPGAESGPLTKAMTLGREKGYATFAFFWRPAVWSRVCSNALEAGIEVEYVRELIREFHLVPENASTAGERWPWPLKIYTFGEFKLLREDKPIRYSRKAPKKPLELLRVIIALGGKNLSEERLMDVLWPDAEGDSGRKSLSVTITRLRELLDVKDALLVNEGMISLNERVVWTDVWGLERMLESADYGMTSASSVESRIAECKTENRIHQDVGSPVMYLERALVLYRGHFLPEESGSWAISPRERMQESFQRAVETLGGYWEQKQAWQKAIDVYRKGIEADDLLEKFYIRTMFCLLKFGSHAEALSVYRRLKKTLEGYGVAISSEAEEIHQQIVGR